MDSLKTKQNQILATLDQAYQSRVNNIKLSIELAQNALDRSREINDMALVGKCLNHASLFYMIVGENQRSIDASLEAIVCFTELKDELGIADAKFNMGSVYYKTDSYHSGLTTLVDCLAIYGKHNEHQKLARVHKSLGAIYEFIGDEKNAFDSYNNAIRAAQEAGDLNLESNSYNPLSGIYLNQNNIEKALDLIERSIAIKTKTGDLRGLAFAYYGRGKIYTKTKQFDLAEYDFNEAERVHLDMGEKLGLSMTYYKMGALFLVKGELEKALSVLLQGLALCVKHNITQFKYKCDFLLYKVYKQLGKLENSFFHLEEYTAQKEAVVNTETLKVIESYEAISKQQMQENSELQRVKEEAEKSNQELQTAEANIKRSESSLQQAQRVAKIGSWEFDLRTFALVWSKEHFRIFELPEDTPPEKLYEAYRSKIHPDDLPQLDHIVAEASQNGHWWDSYEHRVLCNDGSLKYVLSYGEVIKDAQGKPCILHGTTQDITERKKSEAALAFSERKLKRSLKIGNLGTWVVEADKSTMAWSDEMFEMFGVAITDKPVPLTVFLDIIHPEDRERVILGWEESVQRKVYDIEYRIVVENHIKWIKAAGEFEFTPENTFVRAMGIVKDITEHRAYEENLRIAKEQAEKGNRMKSDFLANMSHEIRTPLNGVIGFIDLLTNSNLETHQQEYASIAKRSAHSLLDIINDILDFSKIEADKLELNYEQVDLHEMVSHASEMVSMRAKEKKLKLLINIDSTLPKFVSADPVRLRQVLVNLLGNAIKFTEKGEIELKVEWIEDTKLKTRIFQPDGKGGLFEFIEAGVFRFSVRDTGIGIAPENTEKIFLAFEQEDLTTTKKYGGTGLGLTISNKLLRMMGSMLNVRSELGKGSTFYFDIQLKTILEPQISKSPTKKNADILILEKGEALKSTVRILVVDDNSINRILAKAILKGLLPKAILLEAVNGKEAVALYKQQNPDLILMDIQMPEMNGYEATNEIRGIENLKLRKDQDLSNGKTDSDYRIPIIALTAGTVKGEREKCLDAGMDDYVSKPIVGNSIELVLKKWMFD
jgi:signal transduction histidine kinase/CheY-like chemotaxis protein/tetratricopeptide (TPR) repeat protein